MVIAIGGMIFLKNWIWCNMGELGVCLANLLRCFAEVLLLVVGNADPDYNNPFLKVCSISLKLLNCSKDHTWSCWRKPSSCLVMEFHHVSVLSQMLSNCYTFLLQEKSSIESSVESQQTKFTISFSEGFFGYFSAVPLSDLPKFWVRGRFGLS